MVEEYIPNTWEVLLYWLIGYGWITGFVSMAVWSNLRARQRYPLAVRTSLRWSAWLMTFGTWFTTVMLAINEAIPGGSFSWRDIGPGLGAMVLGVIMLYDGEGGAEAHDRRSSLVQRDFAEQGFLPRRRRFWQFR